MFMTLMPFGCMAIGIVIGLQKLSTRVIKFVDNVVTVMLVVLMLTIGGNIGTNQEVIANIPTIGLNCLTLCLCAIFFSILLCLVVEKTVLPLDSIIKRIERVGSKDVTEAEEQINQSTSKAKKKDPILYIIPISLILGAVGCFYLMPTDSSGILDVSLITSLICLYIGAGVTIGANKNIIEFIKTIGFKIVLLFVGIFIGSCTAGVAGSLILDVPLNVSLISTAGMGYYSMSGANMLAWYGAEAGVYGFMVNVLRDFFTVLLLPLLIKVGKSAPIASSAGGGMDTMLVPVTRLLGSELGIVTLITGVLCTVAVPVIQPIMYSLLG